MSLLVVVLVYLAVPIRAWVINTMTDEIVPGVTNKMWLECRSNSEMCGMHRVNSINITISRYTACGSKAVLAQIDESNDIHTLSREASFTVTGDVISDTSKFLRLTWSEVDVDDAGWYGCEVKGFDVLGNGVNCELKPKDIKVKRFTMADVKQLIKAVKDEYDVTHKRLQTEIENNSRIQSEMEKKHKLLQSEIENKKHLQSKIEKKNKRIHSKMEMKNTLLQSEIENNRRIQKKMEKKFYSEVTKLTSLMNGCQCQLPTTPNPDDDQWPVGYYALIGPEHPCPASHSSEINGTACIALGGYRTVIASTGEQLCYCKLKITKSSRPSWPKGNYCINSAYYTRCPEFFKVQYFEKLVYQYYLVCCRSDGSTSHEIDLPKNMQFYLFTNKENVCQQVKGMTVTQTFEVYDRRVGRHHGHERERIVRDSPRLCHYVPMQPFTFTGTIV